MDTFDEEAIKKYRALLAQYQQNKKDDIGVAENRKHLRLQSIQYCYQAEELAALQDFEDKKSLLYDKLKEDLQMKISQLEDEMYAYQEKKRLTEITRVIPKKQQTVRSRKLPSGKSRKKPVKVKGPYIVYMLKDEEIEEDLNIIKKALRTRELSSKTPESDLENEIVHDYSILAGSINNIETNKNKTKTPTVQSFSTVSVNNNNNNNNNNSIINKSANLTSCKPKSFENSYNSSYISNSKEISVSSPTIREIENKYQSFTNDNQKESMSAVPFEETSLDVSCKACLMESQSSNIQNRIIKEPESNLSVPEELYCSCNVASSEIVYYSESHSSFHHQESFNSQSLNDTLESCATRTEIVDYSETQSIRALPSSHCHTPYTETYKIVSTQRTKIVYFTSGQIPAGETVEIHTSPSLSMHVGDRWGSPNTLNINNSKSFTSTSCLPNSLPVTEKPEDLSVRKYSRDNSSNKREYPPAASTRPSPRVSYYCENRLTSSMKSSSSNECRSVHNYSQNIAISQSDMPEVVSIKTKEISDTIASPQKFCSSKEL